MEEDGRNDSNLATKNNEIDGKNQTGEKTIELTSRERICQDNVGRRPRRRRALLLAPVGLWR